MVMVAEIPIARPCYKQDKIDKHRKTREHDTHALIHAVHDEDSDRVKELLEAGHASPDTLDVEGVPLLLIAANNEDTDCVITLLDAKANISVGLETKLDTVTTSQSWTCGDTTLHLATRNGNDQLVKTLVQRGLPLQVVNQNGSTPIHYAGRHGHFAILQWMVAQGAELLALDYSCRTVVHEAAAAGSLAILQWIVSQFPVNWADKESVKTFREILEAKDRRGKTPLHLATYYQRFDCVQFLCNDEVRATPFVADKRGVRPVTASVQPIATQKAPIVEAFLEDLRENTEESEGMKATLGSGVDLSNVAPSIVRFLKQTAIENEQNEALEAKQEWEEAEAELAAAKQEGADKKRLTELGAKAHELHQVYLKEQQEADFAIRQITDIA